MLPLSKFHFVLAFIALMLLRVVVGFHFFKEGTDKLKNGFAAEYFLLAAKGPLAPHFHKLVDDPDSKLRYCLSEDGKSLNSELTFAIWDDFLDRATSYYRFGDRELVQALDDRRAELAEKIVSARKSRDPDIDTRALEERRRSDEAKIKRLRIQAKLAEEVLTAHQKELDDWLAINGNELVGWFSTRNRVNGFERDGASKMQVATYVKSLRGQVDSIKSDRTNSKREWDGEVAAIWDSYENNIQSLAIDEQTAGQELKLHRPFAQKYSKLQWINQIIPWFDTIVGALLILGLFTRLASLAGAVFLASVIATQPPWIPGTEPTYFYAVELFALLVIFATLAGRFGGLDFFLAHWRKKPMQSGLAAED